MNRLYKAFIIPCLPMSNGYYGVIDLDNCVYAYKYKAWISNQEEIELIKVGYSGGASIDVMPHKNIKEVLGL